MRSQGSSRVGRGFQSVERTTAKKYYNSLVKTGSHDIIGKKEKQYVIGNDNFRIPRSKFLNSGYEDVEELKHSLSDRDVRLWYKARDAEIIDTIGLE